jgi:hypothetical protein
MIDLSHFGPWEQVDDSSFGFLTGVAFGNGTFVTVGGSIRVNPGNGWITLTNVASGNSIAFGNGTFVNVGAGGFIQSSSDGRQWTNQDSWTTVALNRVVFINSRFFAVGDSPTILSSTDGAHWQGYSTGEPLAITLAAGGFDAKSGKFLFTVSCPPSQSVVLEASDELSNWFPISTNTLGGTVYFNDQQAGSISKRFYRARSLGP